MSLRERYTFLALAMLALLVFSAMNYIKGEAFDFDEVFSLAMIEHSFAQIWAITARDYHPPLSYFILKVLSWFVKPFSEGNLAIYRVTAILGYFTIILLCIFPIKRLWGFRVAIIAILLFIFMPISFYIYSNFRMYAWTTPLVLATFIYAYDAYCNNKWAWGKLIVVSTAAMYIHYYSLISTFIVFVLLLFAIVLFDSENKRKQLQKYIASGLIVALLFAPWLYFFVGQLAEVKSDYWIGKPALSDIGFAIQYYFVPKYYTEKYDTLLKHRELLAIIPILLVLTLAIFVLSYVQLRNKIELVRKNINASIFALAVLGISLALVMIYTYGVSPVYHIRYLMCYFGLFVLALAISTDVLIGSKVKYRKVIIGLFALFLIADFALCYDMNRQRSGRTFLGNNTITEVETQEQYYATEDSFTDMAYLSVLHPTKKYFLVTDDNPTTRLVMPPYIEGDTISGMPFSNFQKVKSLEVQHPFMYMTKGKPIDDSLFNKTYQVVDSVYSGLYRVERR